MLRNTITHEGAEDAFILLDRMRNKWHVTPDKRIYAMVLEKIIETNNLEKVEEIRDLMRKDKIILDMDMYNLLLEAYLKLNDETGSSRLLKRLSAVGLTPTPETYKLLLRHYTTTKSILKDVGWLFLDRKDLVDSKGDPKWAEPSAAASEN